MEVRKSSSGTTLHKRRMANDPAMMRELERYQRLMLLSLLPAIPTDHPATTAISNHPSRRASIVHPREESLSGGDTTPLEEHQNEHEDPTMEHLPRPIGTDAFPGARAQTSCSAEDHTSKHTTSPITGVRSSWPSSAGTRLPDASNNLVVSPSSRRGRRSKESKSDLEDYDDGLRQDTAKYEDNLIFDEDTGLRKGAVQSELDMLTLAALYLESRQKVFGRDWNKKDEKHGIPSNRFQVTHPVGLPGLHRPRRLTPLSSDPATSQSRSDYQNNISDSAHPSVLPTPAGLHLSVKYTHNLDLDETAYLLERERALRPRLRRLGSLDEVGCSSPLLEERENDNRPSSAPGLNASGSGFKFPCMRTSPPLVTPARANTPSEVLPEAAQILLSHAAGKHHVDPLGNSENPSSDSRSSSHLPGKRYTAQPLPHPNTKSLRSPVPQFKGRSSQSPPGDAGTSYPSFVMPFLGNTVPETPAVPPPTAAGPSESFRKSSRVHLEPISRKMS